MLGILSVFFGSEGGEEGFGKGAILSVFDSGDCVRGRGGFKVSGLSRSGEFLWVSFFARVSWGLVLEGVEGFSDLEEVVEGGRDLAL